MSEEEREIDVELDEREIDDDLDQASLGGQYDNKRALHNAMERKRRDSIKDSFKGLQDCNLTLKGDKTSRAQVLKKTNYLLSQLLLISEPMRKKMKISNNSGVWDQADPRTHYCVSHLCQGHLIQIVIFSRVNNVLQQTSSPLGL